LKKGRKGFGRLEKGEEVVQWFIRRVGLIQDPKDWQAARSVRLLFVVIILQSGQSAWFSLPVAMLAAKCRR
jgi:hypothetical protein